MHSPISQKPSPQAPARAGHSTGLGQAGPLLTLMLESGPSTEERTQAKAAGSSSASNLLPNLFLLNATKGPRVVKDLR